MALPIIDETTYRRARSSGTRSALVVTGENTGARHCSMAVIRIAPGQRVRPAHSHAHGEEVIYILSGHGRVLIDGAVGAVKTGSAILFPQGSVVGSYLTGGLEQDFESPSNSHMRLFRCGNQGAKEHHSCLWADLRKAEFTLMTLSSRNTRWYVPRRGQGTPSGSFSRFHR